MFALRFLGGACIEGEDGSLTGPATHRHRLALLALLVAFHPRALSRDKLLAFLWPDHDSLHARNLLNQAAHAVRKALGEEAILSSHDELRLCADAVRADVIEFQLAAAAGRLDPAAELYAGPFLDGFFLPGAAEFEHWVSEKRDVLRRAYCKVLQGLAEETAARGELEGSAEWWRRLASEEPYNSRVTIGLMEALEARGDRAGAIREGRRHTQHMRREFGAEESPEIDALVERLKSEPAAARAERVHRLPIRAGIGIPLLHRQMHRHNATAARNGNRAEDLPLVGRRSEWEQLRAAWRTASDGRSNLVVVNGEAGIGKTRLVGELATWTAQQGIATVKTRSYAAEGRLAYAPVVDWLRSEALSATLYRLDSVWSAEVSRFLPEIRLENPDLSEPEPIREDWQRLRLFEALALAVLTGRAPLLLVLDDMQWTDPETLMWLRYLLRFAPEAPLLIAGTIRIEEMDEEPALGSLLSDLRRDGVLTETMLAPLRATETALVAAQVAGEPLDAAQALQLHEETEGNPLFVVETVRAGWLEQTTSRSSLPSKVQAVISARLAQLSGEARALSGLAATVGRVFTNEVLVAASTQDEEALASALDQLWQRHIIREQRAGEYDFSHDKLREAAYAELSPARRRLLHQRVATALEAVYAEDLDAYSGQLAAHYEQAGKPVQAVRYYHRAGRLAKDVHANHEAIRLFKKALAVVEGLPESCSRDEMELDLETDLGASLVALKGYAASEVFDVYDRALVLCKHLDQPTDAPILRALAIGHLVRGDPPRARELGEEILRLARVKDDPVLMVEGHYVLGVTFFWMGHFEPSRRHLELAVQLYDPQQHGVHVTLYAQDPKVVCLSRLGRTLWHLGYADQAIGRADESLALARALGHPASRAYALSFCAQLYIDIGDLQKARECVDELRPLTIEQELALWECYRHIVEGLLRVELGEFDAGIRLIRHGIAVYVENGSLLVVSEFQGYLARAYMKLGATDEALGAIDEGLAVAEKIGVQFCDAELLRLKGELLRENGAKDEAELLFRRSLEKARRQGSSSLMLRAAMQLARRSQAKDDVEKVRRLLRDVYSRFTDGFDTPDLKEAKAMLDAFAGIG